MALESQLSLLSSEDANQTPFPAVNVGNKHFVERFILSLHGSENKSTGVTITQTQLQPRGRSRNRTFKLLVLAADGHEHDTASGTLRTVLLRVS